jgi:hypothetical protein
MASAMPKGPPLILKINPRGEAALSSSLKPTFQA